MLRKGNNTVNLRKETIRVSLQLTENMRKIYSEPLGDSPLYSNENNDQPISQNSRRDDLLTVHAKFPSYVINSVLQIKCFKFLQFPMYPRTTRNCNLLEC